VVYIIRPTKVKAIVSHRRCEAEHPTDALEATVTVTSPDLSGRLVSDRHHWGSLSHKKQFGFQLPDLKRSSIGSVPRLEPGETGLVVHSQKPSVQNPLLGNNSFFNLFCQ
jgi:hypothetical protein